MSTFASIPDRYMLLFNTLLIIIVSLILLIKEYNKIFITLMLFNIIFSIGDIISHSLQIRNPTCYQKYIQSGLLNFDSPLERFIKVQAHASDFCYFEIKK